MFVHVDTVFSLRCEQRTRGALCDGFLDDVQVDIECSVVISIAERWSTLVIDAVLLCFLVLSSLVFCLIKIFCFDVSCFFVASKNTDVPII